jgi:ABC-type uncharacterized transport system permease subunit
VSPLETILGADVVLLPILYLASAGFYGWSFFTGDPRAQRLGPPVLKVTLLLHLVHLVALTVRWQQFPASTISQGLSVVAFAVGVAYVLVEWRGRERATGFWIVGIAFALQFLSSVLHRPEAVDREILHSPVFAAHAFLALVAYAAFVMAAAYGFLFLRLYGELKSGTFTVFYGKLPPLEVLERMMVGALQVGFGALTGTTVLGAIFAERLYGNAWLADPMIVVTLGTWVLYAAALVLRRSRRWQGRHTAVASLAGLGAILVSLVVLNFLVGDFHTSLGGPV